MALATAGDLALTVFMGDLVLWLAFVPAWCLTSVAGGDRLSKSVAATTTHCVVYAELLIFYEDGNLCYP